MNNTAVFPSNEWMQATKDKFNSDERYTKISQSWEGDLRLELDPDDKLHQVTWLYWDLWHGKCREAYIEEQTSTKNPAFILKAPYGNFTKVLSGEVGVMQALMTRMVSIKGNFGYVMRNIPVVLDFVRCCQEVTHSWI